MMCAHKQVWAKNNPQGLICRKNDQNKPNQR